MTLPAAPCRKDRKRKKERLYTYSDVTHAHTQFEPKISRYDQGPVLKDAFV
jgi:hypothetical protein